MPTNKEKNTKLTLKVKLLSLFLITVTITVLIFSDRTIQLLSSVLEENSLQNIQSDSELIASRIKLWKLQNESKLIRISDPQSELSHSFIAFQKNPNQQNRLKVLEKLEVTLFNEPVFIEFSIIDKKTEEILISTTADMKGKKNTRIEESSENKKRIKNSPIFFSDRLKDYIMFIETDLRDESGRTAAIISASVNTHSLRDIFADPGLLEKGSEAYLTDRKGNPIVGRNNVYSNTEKGGKSTANLTLLTQDITEKKVYKYMNYRGEKVFAYKELLPDMDAIFIYEKELSEVFSPIQQLTKKISLLLILILIIATFFASFLIYRFMKPIESLSKTVKQIAGGNYRVRAKINSKDEIGILADKFNQMTDSLVSSLDQLSLKNALLQSQYNTSLFGILAIGSKGEILSYNKTFREIWHFSPGRIRQKTYFEIAEYISEQVKQPKAFIEKLADLKIKSKKTRRKEIELKDGRVIEELSARLPGKTTKALGFIFYFQDITKEAEVSRAKTEFVSLASHQLQTPLTSIKWSLENLMELEKKDKNKHKIAQDAYLSTERMIRLVSDLLNASNLDAGLIVPNSEAVDLTNFIQKQIKKMQTKAKTKKIEIRFTEPKSKINVWLDEKLISNVILSLLSNAIIYSDEKKNITVSIKNKKTTVEISIKDQGIGIPKRDQKQLFTKFFRTLKASRYNANGTGLDLYIAKKILEICKGRIRVSSESDKGSVFCITLPLKGPEYNTKKEAISLIQEDI